MDGRVTAVPLRWGNLSFFLNPHILLSLFGSLSSVSSEKEDLDNHSWLQAAEPFARLEYGRVGSQAVRDLAVHDPDWCCNNKSANPWKDGIWLFHQKNLIPKYYVVSSSHFCCSVLGIPAWGWDFMLLGRGRFATPNIPPSTALPQYGA